MLFVVLAAITKQKLVVYIAAYVFSYAITAGIAYVLTRRYIRVRPVANLRVWRQTMSLSIILGAIGVPEPDISHGR